MDNTIKTFKGFDGDLKCRGFQYEIGKTFKLPEGEEPELCEKGFHAISDDVSPLEAFSYYAPGGNGGKPSRYCEVELSGTVRKGTDKFASSEISIGAEIGIMGLIKAHFDWVKRHITNENNAEKGKVASAGNYGAASAGYKGAASAGENGAASAGKNGAASAGENGAASAGYKGAASAGNYGAASAGYKGAASAGENGAASAGENGAASAGNYGAASAGNYGAASAGNYGAATSRGSSEVGENGLAVVRGNGVKVKGGLGSILVIAEENNTDYDIKEWKAVVVDGETIKADTWYKLVDGELVEAE